MQMAVIAFRHTVFVQHIDQFLRRSPRVDRRVVQKGDFARRIPRRLQ